MSLIPRRFSRVTVVSSGALIVISILGPDPAFAQCALCRDAVNAAAPHIREAMNYAIIGLALAPYGIALAAAWALCPEFRTFVRARFKRPITGEPGNPS